MQTDGDPERFKGYCSDIFAQAAIDFISQPADRPFFAYLAFNCPHEPLEAPEAELAVYRAMNLELSEFPQLGQADPADFRGACRHGRAGLRHDHQHRHQRRQGLEGTRRARAGRQHHRCLPHR